MSETPGNLPAAGWRDTFRLMWRDDLWRRFSRGAFWSMAGALVLRGFTLAASIYCGRLLGKGGLGELSMVQSTAQTFAVLSGLGLAMTVTKHVAEFRETDPGRAGRLIALGTCLALGAASIGTAVYLTGAGFIAGAFLSNPDLAGPLAAGVGLLVFGVVNDFQTGVLAGFEAFGAIAVANAISAATAVPLFLVLVPRFGLRGAIWGFVGVSAANALVGFVAVRRTGRRHNVPFAISGAWLERRALWAFSLPAYLSSLLMGPALWGCNALLARQDGGFAQLGIFYAADRWRLMILFFPAALMAIGLPMLTSALGQRRYEDFGRLLRANVFLGGGLAFGLGGSIALLSMPLMELYGKGYREGWPVLILLAASALPTVLNTVLGQAILSSGMVWARFGFDVLLAIALLGCAALLVPRMGALGLALAYLSSFSAVTCGLAVYQYSHDPRRLPVVVSAV